MFKQLAVSAAALTFAALASLPVAAATFSMDTHLQNPKVLEEAFAAKKVRAHNPVPREIVPYSGAFADEPGTIIVDTQERRLYLVLDDGQAVRYGIGRPGFTWAGVQKVTRKAEWPGWTPPPEMLQRQPHLPKFMAGGPDNPLGARAMYLGSTVYRIHGTTEPWTIGQAVSSGCFRMTNDDVTDLYERVRVGAKVIVR
jgi:lipoprotein-anchoring transpeptidase ErfK/SrfK